MSPPRSKKKAYKSRRVGGVRPSQMIHTYGPGAVVDLPQLSVVLSGTDLWDINHTERVLEPRLIGAVRAVPGCHLVTEFRTPPWEEETASPFDEWARIGVPVHPFPRWVRCTGCDLLSPIDRRRFQLDVPVYRPDRARYFHDRCKGRRPSAVPARFLIACPAGHLDDFPWEEFAHRGGQCPGGSPILELKEVGKASRATDMRVVCKTCGTSRVLQDAFGADANDHLPRCRGRHPHLQRFDAPCTQPTRALLLGASNAWFAVYRSALTIPTVTGEIEQEVAGHWDDLNDIDERAEFDFIVKRLVERGGREGSAVGASLRRRRCVDGDHRPPRRGRGRHRHWRSARTGVGGVHRGRPAQVPRLRGARPGRPERVPEDARPPHRRGPAARGASAVAGSHASTGPTPLTRPGSHRSGNPLSRGCRPPRSEAKGSSSDFPRRVSSSGRGITRRAAATGTYGRQPGTGEPAAGSIPQTGCRPPASFCCTPCRTSCCTKSHWSAATPRRRSGSGSTAASPATLRVRRWQACCCTRHPPDSEGTLGGLVALCEPTRLAGVLRDAVSRAKLCSTDPMCADHHAGDLGDTLHNAACHACLFAPETSCEAGNRYLDRGAAVPILGHPDDAYFTDRPGDRRGWRCSCRRGGRSDRRCSRRRGDRRGR